jgi:hypothetical protein
MAWLEKLVAEADVPPDLAILCNWGLLACSVDQSKSLGTPKTSTPILEVQDASLHIVWDMYSTDSI